MPTSTTNYELIKPGTDDPILIEQINDNMDTIDTVLKDHSDKIDAAALGIKYKGEVNYYADLPNSAEIGDAYTVKYAGSSGTTPDGTEYVWGTVSGTNQWINFSKDSYTKAEVDALLALKQNALNSAQLAAVNSGINSTKVEQIETNKNNILTDEAALIELVNSGAKNLLNTYSISGGDRYGITYTVNSDGSISTTAGTARQNSNIIATMTLPAGTYYVSGCPDGGNEEEPFNYNAGIIVTDAIRCRVTNSTMVSSFTLTEATEVMWRFRVYSGQSIDATTFYPMVCSKAAGDISQTYQPYRPSYQELYEMVKALQANQ